MMTQGLNQGIVAYPQSEANHCIYPNKPKQSQWGLSAHCACQSNM